MKFSEQWLRSWVNPNISTAEMCEQLTMAGLEVDSVVAAASAFTHVVVARVESVAKHPDADKLNVCQVFDGNETLQIVCGAANVRAGLNVPLAKIGAVLPGAAGGDVLEIKPAKLRGVASFGMLCSEKELGLADNAEGLLELPHDAPVGSALREYLQLDDTIIEIDLTPNRGDCLSIAGIARELGALNQCAVDEHQWQPYRLAMQESIAVEMAAPAACTHYAGRIIRNVNVTAETPLWMQERLRRAGVRSLGAIVDIPNYVMLELGQPMHAFDLDTLTNKIVVRYARDGEQITLLDGKCFTLDTETLIIADDAHVLAMAGVMGGKNSGVSASTKSIFLESAFFMPQIIAGKARSYGLHTDSSHRFERGVDPELQVHALERATELVMTICGGEVGPVTENRTAAHPQNRTPIQLREDRIARLLGIALEKSEVTDILQRLGMQVKSYSDGWLVKPPSFRFDITIEADLLEELVRVHGYNNIPRTRPNYRATMQAKTESQVTLDRVRNTLVDRGYYEAITYSFVDPGLQLLLDPQAETVALANPLSSEMSVMRSSLWPGLVQALRHNLNRQQLRVRLFETGLCFQPQAGSLPVQRPRIAGVICGEHLGKQWGESARKVDYYDIKGDVEAIIAAPGASVQFTPALHPALHPGQTARISIDGAAVGWVGALHPACLQALDIEQTTYVFELAAEAVQNGALPVFSPLSKFPEVRRDLALVVDAEVAVSALIAAIQAAASCLLQNVIVFDVYTGQGIAAGRKSIAFGLILQEFSRTLTDHEIDSEIATIVSALKQNFAATLRE